MKEPEIKFSQVLKTLMEKNNMTQKHLASLLNTPESTISTWFSNSNTPQDINQVLKCSQIFNITFFEMVYGEKELDKDAREIKNKAEEILAGKFEIVLRPIK